MTITTLTSREFNQDRARAKRAARLGPVIVTERGKPDLVLLSFEEYQRRLAKSPNLADLLSCPEIADIEDPDERSREIDPRDLRRDELDL
jgi:prevent-host-death family protein